MKVINEDGSTSSINKVMEDSYFGQCLKSLEDMEKDKGKRFFSHDSNAINDPKIIKLTDDHGLLGYGIYWALIELLRNEPEYKCSTNIINRFERTHGLEKGIALKVINNYGLFEIENDMFFSTSLIGRMKLMEQAKKTKSEAGKKGNEKRWGDKNNRNNITELSHSDRNAIAEVSQTAKNASQKIANKTKQKESSSYTTTTSKNCENVDGVVGGVISNEHYMDCRDISSSISVEREWLNTAWELIRRKVPDVSGEQMLQAIPEFTNWLIGSGDTTMQVKEFKRRFINWYPTYLKSNQNDTQKLPTDQPKRCRPH